ncbi:MAG TPA: MlaD family protein [Candidatus Hydrogenedentes bacterium]|nr:MlaD family protein [Candidatus Hydrogenedentota bacterium]
MATRRQKIKVSIFLLICIGIMVAGTLVITGLYQKPGLIYRLEFNESVLGLYEGGMVEYMGVPVGKIREIFVTPTQRAHVEIMIDPEKVVLHEGTEAKLVIYSIAAGTMAVSLSGGEPDGPLLREYSHIPTKLSTIETFSSQLTNILEDISTIGKSIREQLDTLDDTAVSDIVHNVRDLVKRGDAFVEHTDALVVDAKDALQDIRNHSDSLMGHVDVHSKNLERLTSKIETLVDTYTKRGQELNVDMLQTQINSLIDEIKQMVEQMDITMENMDVVAADIVHQTGNVEYSLRGTMTDLRDALDSIRGLVTQLKEDPSAIIRGRGKTRE